MHFHTRVAKQAPSQKEYEERPAEHRHEDLLLCLVICFASLGTTRIHDATLHNVWGDYLRFLKAHGIDTEGFYSPSIVSGRWRELENARFQILNYGFIEFHSESPGYFFLITSKSASYHFLQGLPTEYTVVIPLISMMVLSRYRKQDARLW
jgi:hypothetical protein